MSLDDRMIGRRTVRCGKYAFCNPKRRNNAVEIDVELRQKEDGNYTASFSASVWNNLHTDIVAGGQCQDELRRISPRFRAGRYGIILDLWDRCHLNDLKAGTPEQHKCLDEHKDEWSRGDYTQQCKVLKKYGLFTVQVEGKPYDYGTAWLTWPLDLKDVQKIKDIIAGKICGDMAA